MSKTTTLLVREKCCRNNLTKFKVFWRTRIQRQIFIFFLFFSFSQVLITSWSESRSQFISKKKKKTVINTKVNSYSQARQVRLAGTELHLAGRGCVWFVACQMFPVDFPCWANFSARAYNSFDREFVMTFHGNGSIGGKNGARFEMNFVFNESLCLNK